MAITIFDYLKEEHQKDLTFRENKVLFEKPLVHALHGIGLELKLKNYATTILLYDKKGIVGEVPYEIHQEWHDKGKKGHYDQMYLDFSSFDFGKGISRVE